MPEHGFSGFAPISITITHGPWSSAAAVVRERDFACIPSSGCSRTPQQIVARIAELRPVHEAFAWFRSHARDLEELPARSDRDPGAALGRSGAQRLAQGPIRKSWG